MAPSKDLKVPFEVSDVTPEEDKIIKKCLAGHTKPFIKMGPKGYVMPGAHKKHIEPIYNMEVRPDDVWIVTYPRSGTTWTQELIWLIENNLDFKSAKSKPLFERFPMLETTSHIPELGVELIKADFMNIAKFQGVGAAARVPSWQLIENTPSPRFIKTHLPLSMLPPKLLSTAKVVYVARDPRDVAVSYYYLHKLVSKGLIRSSVRHFWNAFRRDLLPCSPIVDHVKEAYDNRNHENLHFVFYEDLIKDLPHEIRRLCKFFDRKYDDDQLKELAHHVSFDSLKNNKKVNDQPNRKETNTDDSVQFIRKGQSGAWSQHFDEEMTFQAEEFLIKRLRIANMTYPSVTDIYECSYL